MRRELKEHKNRKAIEITKSPKHIDKKLNIYVALFFYYLLICMDEKLLFLIVLFIKGGMGGGGDRRTDGRTN